MLFELSLPDWREIGKSDEIQSDGPGAWVFETPRVVPVPKAGRGLPWTGERRRRDDETRDTGTGKRPPFMITTDMTVTSINERAAEEYFKKGHDAENGSQHERAIEFYERALNENPDHEMA